MRVPYTFVRSRAVALALVAVGTCACRAAEGELPEFGRGADQNILLITIDTLRGDALGAYGGSAATPHIDQLVTTGVKFTFAHAHSVVTLPSHTSILTGRYPFDHGVRDNAGFRASPALDTIAELATRAGRPTGAFVGAFPLDRQFGLSQGFDVYDDAGGRGAAENDFALTERPAPVVVNAAMGWITQQSSPWLAWVHLYDPHAPYAPPVPFNVTYAASPYAGEVAAVDAALGPLLDSLQRGPRRTTIIVTADHGEGLGEHGEGTHGTFAYESTLRVPLIISQVGGSVPLRGGLTSDTPVQHVDIVPTIADLISLPADPLWPGRSLLLRDGRDAEVRASYFEAMSPMLTRGWAPLRGVIADRKKYVDLPIEELYDLATDPGESRNVAATDASRDLLRARLRGFAAALPGAALQEDVESRRRLESLGYVGRSTPGRDRVTEDDDPKRLISLDQRMLAGIDFYQQGRFAEAIHLYQQVVAERPEMSVASLRLAFIQWQSGAVGAAIETLQTATARFPDSDVDVRLATYLTDSGAVGDAIRIFEGVIAAAPDQRDALNGLGIAYARSGRTDEALRMFSTILSAHPRDVQALENRGTVHLRQRAWSLAEAAFRAALAIDPRASRAHAGLGVIALEQGRRSAAIQHWQDAVEMDAHNFDALFNLATELVNVNRFAEARPHLERFVKTAPRAFYGPDIERLRAVLEGR
ncbi:MAG: sulfatase-like hydrolase/transferase [Acidobacteria bacterium]|mgnify:CR=1 FL=1|nr:sulfatase-like hydrolase/transferase [Acidobacteriota bacterium]